MKDISFHGQKRLFLSRLLFVYQYVPESDPPRLDDS
jgi:hypothetical protein